MRDSICIHVDGATLRVESHQTVTSALMRSGISAVRKSPSGEPRGALCAMGSCHECRATVNGVRGVRTCLVNVEEGMTIEREQPVLRTSMGVSAVHETKSFETDVAVIGSGPAGLAAACAAAELGKTVMIIDESPGPGGRIWSHRGSPPVEARPWIERARIAGVQRLQGYSVIDGKPGELKVASVKDGTRHRVHCSSIVIATGARERFLPFPGWTLPGVVGAGALQSLIKGGLPVSGRRLVVAGTGPLLLAVAKLAVSEGATVVVVEQASFADRSALAIPLLLSPSRWRPARELWNSLRGVEMYTSSWVTSARGHQHVQEVSIRTPQGIKTLEVDGLAVGYGLIPESRVAAGLGCEIDEDGFVRVDEHQQTRVPGVLCAGESTGIAGSESALDEGLVAGIVSAGRNPRSRLLARVRRHRFWGQAIEKAHPLRDEVLQLAGAEDVVCRCEDVRAGEITGCVSRREARLIHRWGMGHCQGRVCEGSSMCAALEGSDSVRPPWTVAPPEARIETSR
ncbi:FAD-dependent oxidoreductase [Planctomycetota bacterium]|nr:FAD-dependent oxidoreductase [Planctomycetota bacterium]